MADGDYPEAILSLITDPRSLAIVYLDQNFVAELARARNGQPSRAEWTTLYEILRQLIAAGRLACPGAIESLNESALFASLGTDEQMLVRELAKDLWFVPWLAQLSVQLTRCIAA